MTTVLVGHFPTWEAPSGHCTGGPTPGAQALMRWFVEQYHTLGGFNLGIYNCLSGDTLVMTPDGDVPIRDLAGTDATVLTYDLASSRPRGKWVQAPIRSYGEQELHEVTLRRGSEHQVIRATAEHRWFTRYRKSGTDGGGNGHVERHTTDLQPGHLIPTVAPRSVASLIRHPGAGIPHGLVFGDGVIDSTGGSRIALYGDKIALAHHLPNEVLHTGENPNGVPLAVVTGMSRTWKTLPDSRESSAYLYGFLAGWFAADGRVTQNGGVELYNKDRETLEQARLLFRRLGIHTYPVHVKKFGGNVVAGNYLEQRDGYSLTVHSASLDSSFFLLPKHRERWDAAPNRRALDAWTVVDVRPTGVTETVYCAEVEGTGTFVLAEGILTGNCRDVRGASFPSVHGEGRADDLGFPVADPDGDALLRRLLPNVGKLGIQAIIYERVIYSAKSPTGRPYPGADPHLTHLHVELTRESARTLTYATVAGVLSEKVWKPGERALVVGARGADVAWVQRRLNLRPVDGIYGPATKRAVLRYERGQVKNHPNLLVDGVVGSLTWRLLGVHPGA